MDPQRPESVSADPAIHKREIAPSLVLGIVAALIAPVVWIGCYLWFGYAYIGGVLIGFAIGFAIHFSPGSRRHPVPIVAIVLTALAALVGFVWTEQAFIAWNPGMAPGVGRSIVNFFRDIHAVLFTAVGGYVAYTAAGKFN